MSLKNTRIVAFFSMPSVALQVANPDAYNRAMERCPQNAGCCSECGQGILHHVVIEDLDGSNRRFIGSDCAMKVGLSREQIVNRMTDEDVAVRAAVRAAAKADEAARANTRASDMLQQYGIADAWAIYLDAQTEKPLGQQPGREENVITDIVGKLVRYGNISEPQVRFVSSLLAAIERRPLLEAEKAAAAPCPSGRIVIEGTVLSTKWVDSDFGGSLKMLVKHDTGFKVWCTVPSANEVGKGDRISFTVSVEPSRDDPKFGFGKRPAKLIVIQAAPVAA